MEQIYQIQTIINDLDIYLLYAWIGIVYVACIYGIIKLIELVIKGLTGF